LAVNFLATSNQCKSWYTARILCFNKSFKRIVQFQQATNITTSPNSFSKYRVSCSERLGKN